MRQIDLEATVYESRIAPGEWGVEGIDDDGGVVMATFSGPDAQRRAVEYAEAKFSSAVMVRPRSAA